MKSLMRWSAKNIGVVFIACITLGLAPFSPEPHVWEKLKWVTRGADGMFWYDWFDLLLHGSPWLLLTFGIIGKIAPALTHSSKTAEINK